MLFGTHLAGKKRGSGGGSGGGGGGGGGGGKPPEPPPLPLFIFEPLDFAKINFIHILNIHIFKKIHKYILCKSCVPFFGEIECE